MIEFWVFAGLVLVLALGLLFRPFWFKSSSPTELTRQQINTAIYREQLQRLERDRAENTVSEADYVAAHAELQRRVIDDTAQAENAPILQAPKRTVWIVGTLLPIAAIGLYVGVGNLNALNPEQIAGQSTPNLADLERMVAGLAKKLEKEPNNLEGWAMLARSYKMLGHNAEAEVAFERAGEFVEKDPQLLAIYADLSATNAKGNFAGKPAALIEKALKLDPEKPMALWLAGSAALQAKQFDTAIRTWEHLITQLEPQSEDWNMLKESIDAAYAAAGKSKPVPVPVPVAAATGAATIKGQIELAAALKTKLPANTTVMVIARAPGVRMPVAVLRVKASDFPLSFALDDALSLNPKAPLSALKEVELEVRISQSGMAQAESGDLMSAVQTVKMGASGVTLQVNQIRP